MASPIRSRGPAFIAFFWVFPLAVFAYFSFVKPSPVADQAPAHLGTGPNPVVAMSAQGDYRPRAYVVLRPALSTLDVSCQRALLHLDRRLALVLVA